MGIIIYMRCYDAGVPARGCLENGRLVEARERERCEAEEEVFFFCSFFSFLSKGLT